MLQRMILVVLVMGLVVLALNQATADVEGLSAASIQFSN